MNNSPDDKQMAELQQVGVALRKRQAVLAAAIAHTEEQVADTFERLAHNRPADAHRLRTRAAAARAYAARERDRAANNAQSFPAQP